MTEKIIERFEYRGEVLELAAPRDIYESISKMFDETTMEYPDCFINVDQKDYLSIVKDKSRPYCRIEKRQNSLDYYRYNTLVRTTRYNGENYLIDTYVENDDRGVIACFNDYYFKNNDDNMLIHGNLAVNNGEGMLITGPKRAGKTTLAISMIEKIGANMVSEGLTLLENKEDRINGHYLIKPIHVRLYPLLHSNLHDLFTNLEMTYTTQILDTDAIKKIQASGRDDIDASFTMAREVYAERLGVEMLKEHTIDKIIIPSYTEEEKIDISTISYEEALKTIENQIWPKEMLETKKTCEGYFEKEIKDKLPELKFKSIEFHSKDQLEKQVLEELLE